MSNRSQTSYGLKMEEFNSIIEEKLGHATPIIYSGYNCDKEGTPVNNLNEVPIQGRFIIVEAHDQFWGEGGSYISGLMENASWLDLAVVADAMVAVTGDTHHIFLENVHKVGMLKDIPIYELSMGS